MIHYSEFSQKKANKGVVGKYDRIKVYNKRPSLPGPHVIPVRSFNFMSLACAATILHKHETSDNDITWATWKQFVKSLERSTLVGTIWTGNIIFRAQLDIAYRASDCPRCPTGRVQFEFLTIYKFIMLTAEVNSWILQQIFRRAANVDGLFSVKPWRTKI